MSDRHAAPHCDLIITAFPPTVIFNPPPPYRDGQMIIGMMHILNSPTGQQ